LGRFLQGRRSQVTLTTKFGLQPSRLAARLRVFQGLGRRVLAALPAARRVAVRNAGALYAAPTFPLVGIRLSLEASLRALRTDYVDFFLAHQASVDALPAENVIELLERFRSEGKIRDYGVATEFDWLEPVLKARPQLSRVVQFDSDLTRANAAVMASGSGQTVITYGCLGRSLLSCRDRLHGSDVDLACLAGLDAADDETLAALLLRSAVLSNPSGIILMQSRSAARIERNVRAANSSGDDDRVRALAAVCGRLP
jgi:aryl-alcohol dehydrogenase-like predicted oxidoreductase